MRRLKRYICLVGLLALLAAAVLLGAALFQPGHPLFAAGGRTVVSGPGAAAFTALV